MHILNVLKPSLLNSTISEGTSASLLSSATLIHGPGHFRDLCLQIWEAARSIPPSLRKHSILPLALAICIRIELSRYISSNGQCSINGLEVRQVKLLLQKILLTSHEGFLPLLIAICDSWCVWQWQPRGNGITKPYSSPDDWGMPDPRKDSVGIHGRFVLSGILIGLARFLAVGVLEAPRSTYICPSSSYGSFSVPTLQLLSILIDCFIIFRAAVIIRQIFVDGAPDSHNPAVLIGTVLVVSL